MADYDSGCGGSILTVQDDGRMLIDGGYSAKTAPGWGFPAWTGESASLRGMEQWADIVWKYSNMYGIPAALLAGQYAQESHGQLNAMNWTDNPHGAGISQVTSLAAKQGFSDYDITHDPDLAIRLGVEYFYKYCWEPHGGNPVKALAAYNRGHLQCGTPKQGPNRWNVVTYGDYVTPIVEYANGFIDSGTFDPQNNPDNSNPPPGDYHGGAQDVIGAVPKSTFPLVAIALLALSFGGAYLWEKRT